MYDAVILAGGRSPWLRAAAGTEMLLLARLDGQSIIDRLAGALRASGRVGRIMVTAPEEIRLQLPTGTEFCVAGTDMPTTASLAAAALGGRGKILFVCADIPLLHAAAVNAFLDQCERSPKALLFYPIIPKDVCLRSFPTARRTYGRLADGTFTGGNMMLVDAAVIPEGLKKAREIYARRKNPLALCGWLGFAFLARLLLGRLSSASIAERMSAIMGFPCRVVVSAYAEVGMDVDKITDWQLAVSYCASHRNNVSGG